MSECLETECYEVLSLEHTVLPQKLYISFPSLVLLHLYIIHTTFITNIVMIMSKKNTSHN